jgi:type IV secretion system protein VirB8
MQKNQTSEKEKKSKSDEKSWFKDKYQFVLVQRNILVVMTVISLSISLLAVFAVQQLAPLKSIEPFVIQIDEKSGITEVVKPISRDSLSAPEQLDNFFVWRYVNSRETYDPADQKRRWEIVRVMSDQQVFKKFKYESSPANKESPAAQLGDLGKRIVDNPTISYLSDEDKKVAQVRFTVKERFRDQEFVYNKLATIEYDYYELALNRDERLLNPLGFTVLSYRVDTESARQ